MKKRKWTPEEIYQEGHSDGYEKALSDVYEKLANRRLGFLDPGFDDGLIEAQEITRELRSIWAKGVSTG